MKPVKQEEVVAEVAPPPETPSPPVLPEQTLRLGDDILAMPDESQLRSATPDLSPVAPVITRPPSE